MTDVLTETDLATDPSAAPALSADPNLTGDGGSLSKEDEVLNQIDPADKEADATGGADGEPEARDATGQSAEQQAGQVDAKQLEQAENVLRRALRNNAMSKRFIEGLSPAERLALASDLKPGQADVDRSMTELADLRKQLEAVKKEPAKAEQQEVVTDGAESREGKPAANPKYDELLAKLSDDFGDDAAATMRSLLEAHAEAHLASRRSELESEFQKFTKQLEDRITHAESLHQYVEQRALQTARVAATASWPELQQDQSFDAVRERMSTLKKADPDRYNSEGGLDQAMRDACLLEFGPIKQTTQLKQLADEAANQRRSQASPSSAKNDTPKRLSRDEAEEKILGLLESGKIEEARQFKAEYGF
jgi:hypothetical protein